MWLIVFFTTELDILALSDQVGGQKNQQGGKLHHPLVGVVSDRVGGRYPLVGTASDQLGGTEYLLVDIVSVRVGGTHQYQFDPQGGTHQGVGCHSDMAEKDTEW